MSIKKVMGGYLLGLKYVPNGIYRENVPKYGPVILYGNHISKNDAKLVGLFSKRKLYYIKDKKDLDLKKCYSLLADDKALIIFPEQLPNNTNKLLTEFNDDAIQVGIKSTATIVPFAITGEYDNDRDLTVTFGKPFNMNDMTIEEGKIYVQEKIKELMIGRKED